MEVKKSGQAKGGKHVHLNRVDYPQPRRKSWSVLLKEELEDEDGDHVHLLLAYKVPAKASSWGSAARSCWSCAASPTLAANNHVCAESEAGIRVHTGR